MPNNKEIMLAYEEHFNTGKLFTETHVLVLMGYARGEAVKMKWIPVSEKLPSAQQKEVIGYSPDWEDPDFNPNGTRVCFIFGDGTQWCSAKWIDYQDCYVEDYDTKPTHWMPIINHP